MNPSRIRHALLAAVHVFCDRLEEEREGPDEVVSARSNRKPRRRVGVRPPVLPSAPPTELDRAAARNELRRAGIKVKR